VIKIEDIITLCSKKFLRWTNHVLIRLIQREITTDDVENALLNGEIIEQYPNDKPHPSCLVLGTALTNRQIHVVCGLGENELWLITAYYPSPDEWTADFKTRRRCEQ